MTTTKLNAQRTDPHDGASLEDTIVLEETDVTQIIVPNNAGNQGECTSEHSDGNNEAHDNMSAENSVPASENVTEDVDDDALQDTVQQEPSEHTADRRDSDDMKESDTVDSQPRPAAESMNTHEINAHTTNPQSVPLYTVPPTMRQTNTPHMPAAPTGPSAGTITLGIFVLLCGVIALVCGAAPSMWLPNISIQQFIAWACAGLGILFAIIAIVWVCANAIHNHRSSQQSTREQ